MNGHAWSWSREWQRGLGMRLAACHGPAGVIGWHGQLRGDGGGKTDWNLGGAREESADIWTEYACA